jgi:hypothetical protein
VPGQDEGMSLFRQGSGLQLEGKNRDFGGVGSLPGHESLSYPSEVGWVKSKFIDVVVGCRTSHKYGLANVSLALCIRENYLMLCYYSRDTRLAMNASRHYPRDIWRQTHGKRM